MIQNGTKKHVSRPYTAKIASPKTCFWSQRQKPRVITQTTVVVVGQKCTFWVSRCRYNNITAALQCYGTELSACAGSAFADFRGTSLIHTAAGSTTVLEETLLMNNNVSEAVLSGASGVDGAGATVSVEKCDLCSD